jgi:hypothetical protein
MSLENARSAVYTRKSLSANRGFLLGVPVNGTDGEASSRSKSSAWKYIRIGSVRTSLATLGVIDPLVCADRGSADRHFRHPPLSVARD